MIKSRMHSLGGCSSLLAQIEECRRPELAGSPGPAHTVDPVVARRPPQGPRPITFDLLITLLLFFATVIRHSPSNLPISSMHSPSSPALQQLLHLDASSLGFPDELINVLSGQEYRQYSSKFESDDARWLADYLDKVCRCVAFVPSLLKLVLDSRLPRPIQPCRSEVFA